MTRIKYKNINMHMTYTIKDLSGLLHVGEKTIQRWIDKGLEIVSGGTRPILLMGLKVKEFLKEKDAKRKVKLKRNEFYCLRCKAARHAKRGSLKVLSNRKIGVCRVCSGKVSKIFKPYQKGLFDTGICHPNVPLEAKSIPPLL